jgi:glycosyltransferase involved in cell wall biosynthesis
MNKFHGKVGIIQRVLPHYRKPFFETLGEQCSGGLSVFTGQPRPDEMIKSVEELQNAQLTKGRNFHILKSSLYLCIQTGLINWLQSWDPDVLIVEANPRYLSTPRGIRWMHHKNRPVIGWGLGAPPISGIFGRIRTSRRKNFLNQFDALITYSSSGASEYARLGFPKDRIHVAPNAVTPPPTHPIPDRPIPEEDLPTQILFVGRLQERKNLDNLIIACSHLPGDLQPELVIVGDGPDRGRLVKMAEEVYPRTIFTGSLYGNDLAKQFQRADLFVLPGTGGLAVQQAMSYALPVIAAQADGTQDDLISMDNGWQVPADDIPALESTLREALENKIKLREMGKESYRIVAEEINLNKMVDVFIEVLNRSLS